MTWNKKNQQFALSCAIRPSTKELAQWLLRKTNDRETTQKIIDLREWNTWVSKHRPQGSYDRKTAKEALAQLDELTHGWFTVVKSYSWAVHQVLVRPVTFAIANQSQKLGMSPKLRTGQPMFDGDHKKRVRELLLQNISKLDTLLRKIGLKCNQETLARMWRYSGKKMSNIQDAVEYMLRCHAEKLNRGESIDGEPPKGITSPIGWLHDCLKFGRYQSLDDDSQLPYILNLEAIAGLVRDISPPESICDRNQLRYQT